MRMYCPNVRTYVYSLVPQPGSLKFGVYTGVCAVCGQRLRFRSAEVTERPVNAVVFSVNGVPYSLDDVDPVVTLSEWLKEQAGLKGTKFMCREGGCGACVVALTRNDVLLQRQVTLAVNSVTCNQSVAN
jgi:xanthine dehydrogenase/oxidase